MNKTPRTDEKEFAAIDLKPSARVVYASFARQLETELADKDRQLAKARAEIERLEKGIKTVQSAFKNHKNADAAIARIKLREAKILKASCNLDAVNSERAANEILTEELEKARAEIENLQWRVSDEQAKTKALLELNDKALELVNEARADAEHWRAECNSLQRMVHEARAVIEHKNRLIEQMREALKTVVSSAPPGGPLWHGSAEIEKAVAAIKAAERGE